jgi:hypothetical protein
MTSKTPAKPAPRELTIEEMKQAAGGAAYMKYEGIKGQ